MKTIVRSSDHSSFMSLHNDSHITFKRKMLVTNGITHHDVMKSDIVIFDNVEFPEDWEPNKYLYKNGSWQLNPDWIEPVAEETVVEEPVVEEQPA